MNNITILKNANIVTLNKKNQIGQALLIKNGIIEEIGKNEEISSKNLTANVIDVKGKTVLPSFIDSHMHMITGAVQNLQLNISKEKYNNANEMFSHIKEATKNSKGWIRVCGFEESQILSGDGKNLNKNELDRFFPDRPVIILRICGHMCIVNSMAIKELNISNDIVNPQGGYFERDENSQLTGVAKENAQQYMLDRMPLYSDNEILQSMKKEQNQLFKYGICSIHDAGTDQTDVEKYIDLYIRFNESKEMKIKTYLMVRPIRNISADEFIEYIKHLKKMFNFDNSNLYFGAVKLFADGSIGGKTAGLYGGYIGEPNNKGLLMKSDLDMYIEKCHLNKIQTITHAIGDQAIEYTIDNIIKAQNKDKYYDNRHRIEHCEVSSESIINKMANNKILAMVQPSFIYYFGDTYKERIASEQLNKIKAIKTMLTNNILVGFGTDYPVINVDPFVGIKTSIDRRTLNRQVLNQNESIKMSTALKCYTINSAYGSFTENREGSIEKGKLGNLIILNENPFEIDGNEIASLEIDSTICQGNVVYSK